jgi:Calcineurin-like phosphoesterase
MTRAPRTRKPKTAAPHETGDDTGTTKLAHPVFSQPQPTPDPTKFEVKHPSDDPAYKQIDVLNREHKLAALPFPAPRGLPEPRLTLAAVLDDTETSLQRRIGANEQIVFHCMGDTGSTRGPESQNLVADKMVNDFTDEDKEKPSFFLHLGDVIYSFGEAQYYYDQFYEPYRDYPAPIVSLAGNHDGMVAPGSNATSLEAFLDNFCASEFEVAPEAGGLSRTAQIQPGVFFTFEAPFVRILALYSNTLEDPGIISDATIGDSQLVYLKTALQRAKSEGFEGALILAHHHPAYTAGSKHGWSVEMLSQIDAICNETGVWPHAVLSGHAHNYQRFTRIHGKTQIPYIICGNGGHALAKLQRKGESALRTPQPLKITGHADKVTLENYDDQDYGYLRIIVTKTLLRIEYHPASDGSGAKTPDDFVTVDLATRKLANISIDS